MHMIRTHWPQVRHATHNTQHNAMSGGGGGRRRRRLMWMWWHRWSGGRNRGCAAVAWRPRGVVVVGRRGWGSRGRGAWRGVMSLKPKTPKKSAIRYQISKQAAKCTTLRSMHCPGWGYRGWGRGLVLLQEGVGRPAYFTRCPMRMRDMRECASMYAPRCVPWTRQLGDRRWRSILRAHTAREGQIIGHFSRARPPGLWLVHIHPPEPQRRLT